jgi:hypothetical protein
MLIHFKPRKGENWRSWDVVVAGRTLGQVLNLSGPHGFSYTSVSFAHRVSNHVRNAADIFAEGLA